MQTLFNNFVLIFDFLLTACLTLLLIWQGWAVTEKFLSSPQKISISYKGLEDMLPISISLCYILKVTDCSEPNYVVSMFDDYSSYDDTEECTWKEGEIGSYGNSSKTLWEEVVSRSEPVAIKKTNTRA